MLAALVLRRLKMEKHPDSESDMTVKNCEMKYERDTGIIFHLEATLILQKADKRQRDSYNSTTNLI